MHNRSDYDFDVISGPSTRPPAPPPLPPAPQPRPGADAASPLGKQTKGGEKA